MTELNASQCFLKLLIHQHVKEVHYTDPFLQELVWILGQLSQKGTNKAN